MSRTTIERLYAAFERLDAEAMAACYAQGAVFDDEAFSLQGRAQIGGMWAMLCEAIQTKGRDVWKLEVSQVTERSAHWEPTYRFSATGRMVHNIIDAEFEFDAQGLIVRQRDRFDFWRWARQALGAPGLLLGWSPMLRNKVRATAAKNLARFLASTPSPSGRG
ncbi:MAG: nuclear transport factor 2 family protein [Burkholderiaceae bacterium]|nr:nuclear transport factor 2 family protein [Burkholderiaceae bacterium]